MANSFSSDFIEKVLLGIKKCKVDLELLASEKKALGVGVSGGADSIALLYSLAEILNKYKISLYVITVNHFIRPDEETCGDCEFVKQQCLKLKKQGYLVECIEHQLPRGTIQDYCEKNGAGVEESARHFRYGAFEKYIAEYDLQAFCLAHNKNDQLETALMRFLQGNSQSDFKSIPQVRGKFIRPMLDISRNEIEAFLQEKHLGWRTDSTNFDTLYLRNKIRHKLIPFLNEEFNGWDKSVLSGVEKSMSDRELIDSLVEEFEIHLENGTASFPMAAFCNLKPALQYRILIKSCNKTGLSQRIPYGFLEDVITGIHTSFDRNTEVKKSFADVIILCKNSRVFVKKQENNSTDLVFFDIIKGTGSYDFPFGKVDVIEEKEEKGLATLFVNGSKIDKKIALPFILRNAQLDDEIKTSTGVYKKIAAIYKDWHLSEEAKQKLPVIQELFGNQKIVCILGESLGYSNWIVR